MQFPPEHTRSMGNRLIKWIFIALIAVGCVSVTPTPVAKEATVSQRMCERLMGATQALQTGIINNEELRQTVLEIWEKIVINSRGTDHPDVQFVIKGVDEYLKDIHLLDSKPYTDLVAACYQQ